MKLQHLLIWLVGIGLLPLSGCQTLENAASQPCLRGSYLNLRGLPIGASMTMEIGSGQLAGSDCLKDPEAGKSWTWTSSDRTIATVSPLGVVTGVKPGTFSLKATKGDQTLEAKGFIMPQKWTVEFEPPAATVKVGESVTLKVVAYDENHQKLPPVPFSVYTPEFFLPAEQKSLIDTGSAPSMGKTPLVDKWSQQQMTGPATFRATRPGVTKMIGEIGKFGGDKRAEATVTITP
jgi:Bacterial Ig-like domain (group 2)